VTDVALAAGAALLVWSGAARVARFAAHPPTAYADVDRDFAKKLDAYAAALGVTSGSALVCDGGATLMDSHLRIYDEAGLFEPDVVRTLKHDGTHWLFNHPDFYDWVFETVKPTFLTSHDFFTYVTAFEKDPRFARDYAPIDAYIDRYVEAAYKTQLRSGIYVRKDALHAPGDVDRARDSYRPLPRRDPFVTRMAEVLGWDPAGPSATDEALRAGAMAARYERQDPDRAATLFARLAERKPDDLEATQEEADALDAAWRSDEARPWWAKVRDLAVARRDAFRTDLANNRLRGVPPPAASEAEQARLMQAGLDALFKARDAATAVDLFRQVLDLNPLHYGASYQLGVALDAAGRKDEARAHWPVVLRMAQSLHDQKTADDVQARIASGG
jgi:tetratricopeptide (TPR) repeat protein